MESKVRDAKWFFSKHLKLELTQEKTRIEEGCYRGESSKHLNCPYCICNRAKNQDKQFALRFIMVKIGIMICDRNRTCTGNKCFKSIIERDGAFAEFRKDEPIEVVGWMACGGCPGERLEHAPADMKKYGAEVIYLASCYLAGYPICPYIEDHKNHIEKVVGLHVKVGTHPMPRNYLNAHDDIGDWKRDDAAKWLGEITGNLEDADKYDSTNPNFLKK